jgi:hypothetical protein
MRRDLLQFDNYKHITMYVYFPNAPKCFYYERGIILYVLLTCRWSIIGQSFYEIPIVHPENIYCRKWKTNAVQCIDVFYW